MSWLNVILTGASPATLASPFDGDTAWMAGPEGPQDTKPHKRPSGSNHVAQSLTGRLSRAGAGRRDPGLGGSRGDLAELVRERRQLGRVDEHDREL